MNFLLQPKKYDNSNVAVFNQQIDQFKTMLSQAAPDGNQDRDPSFPCLSVKYFLL
jgi:hypothetical protein